MGTILLIGGTGFVGAHLRPALKPNPVVLLGRKEPDLLANERWSYLDMKEPVAPERLSEGEVLCHLAYSMGDGSRNTAYNQHLLEATNACSNIRRVVLMSSISVYGTSGQPVIDEGSLCQPVGEYAETKLACERMWREGLREDCDLAVLRPTEIVGLGGKGLLTLIRDAVERPVVGAVKRSVLHQRSLHYVAVSNVVAAIRFCIDHPQDSPREVYVVSDDHRPENKSYAAMQDLVRDTVGRRALPGPAMTGWMPRVLGKLVRRPLGVGTIYASQKIRNAGFKDALPLRDEVRRLVQGMENSAKAAL